MAAYVTVSLFAGNLVSHIRSVLARAVPSPHSKARMIVFAEELNALRAVTPDRYLQPALDESMRVSKEIKQLQRSRKDADSAAAALQRIAADISAFLPEGRQLAYGQLEQAATVLEQIRDLARTELMVVPDSTNYPTESELAACFYPIRIRNIDKLRDGDCVFVVEKKTVAYQHGNPREQTPIEKVVNLPGTVVMRPFGAQAVLALRWHRSVDLLGKLADQCGTKKAALQRKQGLQMAVELLSAPSWQLTPMETDSPKAAP